MLLSYEERLAKLGKLIEKLQTCGVSCEARWAEEGYVSEDGTLYLTDRACMVCKLYDEGLPVLAYLHEGNRGENFSGAKYACEDAGELEPEYLERVYRRFKGLPWKILETERCVLRESVEEDVDAFFEIYANPAITRYMENLHESRMEERAYIREYREKVYAFYEFGVWTVILKETGEIIGRAGLSVREGSEIPELGYVIGMPWQGRGLAREVCRGILEYADAEFEFEQIQAVIHRENIRSIKVADALGFEKQLRSDDFCENVVFFVRSKQ